MKNKSFDFGIRLSLWGVLILTLLASCQKNNRSAKTADELVWKKHRLQKQIDSLKKELVKIEKQLRDTLEEDIPQIGVDTVRLQSFAYYVDLQGVVKSDGNVTVVPLFQGEVEKIYKKPGDKVRKGEVLMKIDDKVLRNQIDEVRTQYALAKTSYERRKRLWKQKIGSEMAYLQARTQYLSLAKKLRTLNEQLKKARITSPLSGTVDDIMIKEGETAMPGRPAARVVNLRDVYVEADVSEKFLKDITPGKPVIMEFPEAGIRREGKVDYAGNFIHPSNRTFKIRVNTPNPSGLLKPNLTADIKVLSRKIDSAIVIPVSLVQEDSRGRAFVFVLVPDGKTRDGRRIYVVKKQPVERGLVYDKKIWIKSGLQPGALLPLTGAFGLSEGDKVLIKTSKSHDEEKDI